MIFILENFFEPQINFLIKYFYNYFRHKKYMFSRSKCILNSWESNIFSIHLMDIACKKPVIRLLDNRCLRFFVQFFLKRFIGKLIIFQSQILHWKQRFTIIFTRIYSMGLRSTLKIVIKHR